MVEIYEPGWLPRSVPAIIVKHNSQEKNAVMRADPVDATRDANKERAIAGHAADERRAAATKCREKFLLSWRLIMILDRGELDAEDNTIGPFETHVLMNHVLGRQDLQLLYHMHVVGSTLDRKMHLWGLSRRWRER